MLRDSEVVDWHDVGMFQRGEYLRLLVEAALEERGVAAGRWRRIADDFHGDVTVDRRLVGAKHLRRAAVANLLIDDKLTDLPLHESAQNASHSSTLIIRL